MIANLNIDSDLTGRYEFDIRTLLIDMENIFKKYIVVPKGLKFVKGTPLPMYDRDVLRRHEEGAIELYDTPQCPFIAPNVIKDILEVCLINGNPRSKLLCINSVLDKESPIYDVNKDLSYTDILLSVIPTNKYGHSVKYTNEELVVLLDIVDKIIDKFIILINNDYRYIYSIDITKEIFVVYRHVTVGEYRYSECEHTKQIEKEYENDLHGNAFRSTE